MFAAEKGQYEAAELKEHYMCPSCHIPAQVGHTPWDYEFSIGAYEEAYRRNYQTGATMALSALTFYGLAVTFPRVAAGVSTYSAILSTGEAASRRSFGAFNPSRLLMGDFTIGRRLSTPEQILTALEPILTFGPLALAKAAKPPALALADDVPVPGGVPAVAGVDYHVPGGLQSMVPYEATATPRLFRNAGPDFFEPRSPLVANITGGGGFTGGTISAVAPAAGATPELPAITRDLTNIRGNLSPPWLQEISRSGVESFVFKPIAQDAEQLAQWNQAVRTVATRADSTYARTLGQRLTKDVSGEVFHEVNREFFRLRGIAGAGTHNTHHWLPRRLFPELALDPRNLYLATSALDAARKEGR
jgi:hypothetical protein